MKPSRLKIIVLLFIILPLKYLTPCNAAKEFPPFYIEKIELGDKFVSFNFEDLDGNNWSNKYYLSRPIVFITGNWALRHDLRKWANYLNIKQGLNIDIIWLFNPVSTEFADRNNKSRTVFNKFKPPVPVVTDNHSLIGRSLKINYQIPTLIGLTKNNRLAFVYASPCNQSGKKMANALIEQRLILTDR